MALAPKKLPKAYALVVTLTMVFCSFLLLLTLSIYSRQAAILGAASMQDVYRQRLIKGIHEELAAELDNSPESVPTLNTLTLDDAPFVGELDWQADSTYIPFDPKAARELFKSWDSKKPPGLGYSGSPDNQGIAVVPPWHATAVSTMPGGDKYQSVFSTAFPYGVFAPWGGIDISGTVEGFGNPSFKDEFGQKSHVPVSIAAGGDIDVEGSYPLGTARSVSGTITLPDVNSALPITGVPFADPFTNTIKEQVMGENGLFKKLSAKTVKKTDFITGSYLDPKGLYELLAGNKNLTAIFSLQQACAMPMPVLPTMGEGEGYQIIFLHNPYPTDYKGKAETLSFLNETIKALLNAAEAAEKAVVDAWKAVGDAAAGLYDDAKGVWDEMTGQKKKAKKEFKKANENYEDAKKQLDKALDDLTSALDEFAQILKDVNKAEKPLPPVTIAQEQKGYTVGWAYFGILSRLAEDLGEFFTSVWKTGSGNWNDLFEDLANDTRVVHFVDRNPLGGFSKDGGFTLISSWTVPRGRTLHLGNSNKPDYVIVGDVWIQRGATLYVQGSLFVEAPTKASEESGESDPKAWAYDPESGNDSDIIPTGTIYLEPGASLVVDGVLYAEGNRDNGSINICSPAGVTTPLSTAVLVKGDVKLPFGTGSGLTVDRMLEYVAEDLGNSALKGLADDFFVPVLIEAAPQIAKLSGPFHERICWFSEYAASFVLIDELAEFGLQGPWPIPLPYTNCWIRMFEPLGEIYVVELNFALGENLYTHTEWWPFGQGVTPVVPKVDPENYAAATLEGFGELSKDDLNPDSVLKTVKKHLEEVVPAFANQVFQESISSIVRYMISEASGDIEDPCAKVEEADEEKEESGLKKESDAYGEVLLEKLKVHMIKMFGQILSSYRDAVASKVDDLGVEGGAARELPGVFLYCGGALDIGSAVPGKASGFFYAEGDVTIAAAQTFGSVVSRTGNVSVQGDMYYYPFFSKASLWKPQAADSYGVDTSKAPSFFTEFLDVFQDGVYILVPENGSTLSVGVGRAVKLAEGPR